MSSFVGFWHRVRFVGGGKPVDPALQLRQCIVVVDRCSGFAQQHALLFHLKQAFERAFDRGERTNVRRARIRPAAAVLPFGILQS